jgi:hypothetical protein
MAEFCSGFVMRRIQADQIPSVIGGIAAAFEKPQQSGALKRNGFRLNRHFALAHCLSMIFSDLSSPAEASNGRTKVSRGFARAGNRFPLFEIML